MVLLRYSNVELWRMIVAKAGVLHPDDSWATVDEGASTAGRATLHNTNRRSAASRTMLCSINRQRVFKQEQLHMRNPDRLLPGVLCKGQPSCLLLILPRNKDKDSLDNWSAA
jgi:hypothetical protein